MSTGSILTNRIFWLYLARHLIAKVTERMQQCEQTRMWTNINCYNKQQHCCMKIYLFTDWRPSGRVCNNFQSKNSLLYATYPSPHSLTCWRLCIFCYMELYKLFIMTVIIISHNNVPTYCNCYLTARAYFNCISVYIIRTQKEKIQNCKMYEWSSNLLWNCHTLFLIYILYRLLCLLCQNNYLKWRENMIIKTITVKASGIHSFYINNWEK